MPCEINTTINAGNQIHVKLATFGDKQNIKPRQLAKFRFPSTKAEPGISTSLQVMAFGLNVSSVDWVTKDMLSVGVIKDHSWSALNTDMGTDTDGTFHSSAAFISSIFVHVL